METRPRSERVEWFPELVLKRDLLGAIVLGVLDDRPAVLRRPSTRPMVGWIARALIRRERRALQALAGLDGVPALLPSQPAPRGLLRSYLDGVPLSQASTLRTDFFELLELLVVELHRRGVCHNDLHKEANILVRGDGRPALVDFQLASVHARRGGEFRRRAREDLRHVRKHHAYYLRVAGREASSVVVPPRRLVSRTWRCLWKPLYNGITRSTVLRRSGSGEPARRPRGQAVRWIDPKSDEPGQAS